jgi:hypothetical protein
VWTNGDPAATKIEENDNVVVLKLNGPLDPATCPRSQGAHFLEQPTFTPKS